MISCATIFLSMVAVCVQGWDQPMSVLVHQANYGDIQSETKNWVGHTGVSKQLELMKIWDPAGTPADHAQVEYMCHLSDFGDTLWLPQGSECGTRGQGRALEGFAVRVRTNTNPPGQACHAVYRCHLAGVGDENGDHYDGRYCGTRGESRAVESIWVRVWCDESVASPENDLETQFAPVLAFPGGQNAYGYPMSATTYIDSVIPSNTGFSFKTLDTVQNPTYSKAYPNSQCSGKTVIAYAWFYGYQEPCIYVPCVGICAPWPWDDECWCLDGTGVHKGYHDGDWEGAIVYLNADNTQVEKMRFEQHGGYYTVDRSRMAFYQGSHPVVYVERQAHGAYHFSGSNRVVPCGYFYGERGDSERLYTQHNLIHMNDCGTAQASTQCFTYDGNWQPQSSSNGVSSAKLNTLFRAPDWNAICNIGCKSTGCDWDDCDPPTFVETHCVDEAVPLPDGSPDGGPFEFEITRVSVSESAQMGNHAFADGMRVGVGLSAAGLAALVLCFCCVCGIRAKCKSAAKSAGKTYQPVAGMTAFNVTEVGTEATDAVEAPL